MNRIVAATILLVSLGAHACPLPEGVDEGRVVPVIRGNSSIGASFPSSPKSVPRYVLNSEISVVFALDAESSIAYFLIPTEELGCWQDFAQVGKYLPNIEKFSKHLRAAELSPGLFMMLAGGSYESSYLLEAEFLSRTARSRARSVVVGIPGRDVLLFAASEDRVAIDALRDRVARVYKNAERGISNKLRRLELGRVSVLD